MDKEKVKVKGNLVGNIKVTTFLRNEEEVTVSNFALVKKYGNGKEYINCAYYNEDISVVEDLYKGDLVYVYGYFNEKVKGEKRYKNFVVESISKIDDADDVEIIIEKGDE